MSIDSLTGDEFSELTEAEHAEALALYADSVTGLSTRLKTLEAGTTAHEDCLDKMARQLTLRRVHQVRLAEMQEEAQPAAGLPASAQYDLHERQPAHLA